MKTVLTLPCLLLLSACAAESIDAPSDIALPAPAGKADDGRSVAALVRQTVPASLVDIAIGVHDADLAFVRIPARALSATCERNAQRWVCAGDERTFALEAKTNLHDGSEHYELSIELYAGELSIDPAIESGASFFRSSAVRGLDSVCYEITPRFLDCLTADELELGTTVLLPR